MKPQAFMPYRINGQYIMEGLCGGMFYTLGGVRGGKEGGGGGGNRGGHVALQGEQWVCKLHWQ